jgi:hypothetical protein
MQGSEYRVKGSWLRVNSLGFRVWGLCCES